MRNQSPAETAIAVARYMERTSSRLNASGEVDRENPYAVALYIVAITVGAAIINGKLLEFASHCFEFTAKQAGRESPTLTLHAPAGEPSNN